MSCDVCFSEEPCGCYEWLAYWQSLTPAERREEERMMAEYTLDC